MSAVVLLHPAMSGAEAHDWCSRHAAELEVSHRQGKIHLIVVAQPRGCTPKAPVPASLVCSACGWAGADPRLIPDPAHSGYQPVCPRCDATFPTLSRSP